MDTLEERIVTIDEKEMQTQTERQRRGRRLRSLENCRALLAATLRRIENDPQLKQGERYRLLVNGTAELARIVGAIAERDGRLDKLEGEIRRLLDERQPRMAS